MIWFFEISFYTNQYHYTFLQVDFLGMFMIPGKLMQQKLQKKPTTGIDRGDSLVFQEFIQSWVGYELVKVLNVFGLQPNIRSDFADWSPDLFATFSYLSNRSNDQHKLKDIQILDLLFDQTEHNSYFGK